MENARDMEPARATPASPQAPAPVTARDWDERVDRASQKLPESVQRGVAWLREPPRFPVRLLAAILLILGGIFSILPVLGLWMLPPAGSSSNGGAGAGNNPYASLGFLPRLTGYPWRTTHRGWA